MTMYPTVAKRSAHWWLMVNRFPGSSVSLASMAQRYRARWLATIRTRDLPYR
jgi:hypothetical protein